MKFARGALLALSMFAGPYEASAKESVVEPVPIGSPADWVRPEDYPRDAARLGMEGRTAFRLTVDAKGKPVRCDITESSGFDILDTATCERLMANARFAALRGKRGAPKEDAFVSAVVWNLLDSEPMTERIDATLLSIDQTGKVASCRYVRHFPVDSAAPPTCEFPPESFPVPLGLELRGNFQGPIADIELHRATVFSQELRERALAPMPGYEQRSLLAHRFTVNREGRLESCALEQQRGAVLIYFDFCASNQRQTFDPPFSAIDKDGVATGWFISRVLIKNAE
jgi:TonB family protein